MADYVLSARGTYDGSNFDRGISESQSRLQGFLEEARSVGQKVRSALADNVVRAADGITSAIGDIGASVVALAATGGISRALNLEKAEHLFDGIGLGWETMTERMDATTGKFMTYKDIVNEAVSDTQFSLDEAAIVAANLGAAGVKSGDQLAQALDAATGIASTFSADLMDIGGVFQKVAAQGKVMGDNVNQLASRGVNALDALAQHFGVTQEEMREMITDGLVSFQDFSDAMTEAFGGSAKTANETFAGSLANVKAALSRVGAKFATPGLDALTNIFNALRPLINAVSAALDPLVERFTGFLGIAEDGSVQAGGAVDKLTGLITMLTEKVTALGEGGFDNLSTGAKAAAAAIGLLSLGSIGGLISQIPILGDALGGVFGLLGNLSTPVGSLVRSLGGVTSALGAMSAPMLAVVGVVAALAAGFAYMMATDEEFRASIMQVVSSVGNALAPVLETVVTKLLPAIQSLLAAVLPILGSIAGLVVTVAGAVISALAPVLELVIDVLSQVLDAITPVIDAIGSVVVPVVKELSAFIADHMDGISDAVSTVCGFVSDLIGVVMGTISGVIEAVMLAISGDWSAAWKKVGEVAQSVWNGIKSLVGKAASAVAGIVSDMANAVAGFFGGLWSKVTSTVSDMWNNAVSGFRNGVGDAINAVAQLPNRIIDLFRNAGSWLYESGRSIITGLVDGIWGAIGWAASSVGDALSGIRNMFPFSPAKEGPFSGRGWVLYSGISIMDALAEGAGSEVSSTVSAFSKYASRVRDALETDMVSQPIALGFAPDVSFSAAGAGNVDARSFGNAEFSVVVNVNADSEQKAAGIGRTLGEQLYLEFSRRGRLGE